MIAVLQRVNSARVYVKGDTQNSHQISHGLCVLLGVAESDTKFDAEKIADKIGKIRIFSDANSKMNLDINENKGEILLISQFTLIASVKGQNRPSFIRAAKEDLARQLYTFVIEELGYKGLPVQTGFFGKNMVIEMELDGPVTITLDSKEI